MQVSLPVPRNWLEPVTDEQFGILYHGVHR
jgi:hypothetical protein